MKAERRLTFNIQHSTPIASHLGLPVLASSGIECRGLNTDCFAGGIS
jgi:hypothetical protein